MESERRQDLSSHFSRVIKDATGVGAFQREFIRSRGSSVLEKGADAFVAGVTQFIAPIISRRLEEEKVTKNWDDYFFAVSVLADASIIGLIILANPNLFAALGWKFLYNFGVSAVPHKIK